MMNAELKEKDGQQYCIKNPDGICLAIAGPGTGKTYAIAHRIETVIKNGCPTERILCLTFTDTASEEMRKSIKKALDEDNLDSSNLNVNISTFHSFCMGIIKEYTSEFDLKEGVKVIPDSVARFFIKDLTDEIKSEYLVSENTGSRYQYIDAILDGIKEIKKYNISYEELCENLNNSDLSDKEKNKTLDLWKFYEQYEIKKEQRGYIDFADMIIMVVQKFKDKEFLKEIASSYDYILIDEYQDTNPLQNEIVYALGEFCPNIFAVGDDDQTIFAFQGAKITTMKEFIEHFEKANKEVEVVTFNNNRRSNQNIVDFSREVVLLQKKYAEIIEKKDSKGVSGPQKEKLSCFRQIYLPLEHDEKYAKYKINKKLNAINQNLKNNPIECYEYEDADTEMLSIIEKIKELKKDTPLNEIAVLAKSNSELEKYAQLLKRNNIPYELKEGANIFEINSVNILISYLELLLNPDVYSGRFYSYLLSPVFHLNAEDFNLIFKNRAHASIIDLMKNILKSTDEKKQFKDKEKIEHFIKTYEALKAFKEGVGLDEAILVILNETGILDYYVNLEAGKVENLLGLSRFVDEARGYQEIHKDIQTASNLAGFLKNLEDLNNDDIKITANKPDYKLDAVQLSTYHSSKGKEYKHVFLPSLNKSKWESRSGGGGTKITVPYKKDKTLESRLIEIENQNEPKYYTKWVLDEAKYMEMIKLLFVGITRAKEGLYLSYTEDSTKASIFLKIPKEQFISLKEKFIFCDKNKEIANEEENIQKLYKNLKVEKYNYKTDFKELVNYTIDKINAFSPTRLNDWLNCPRRFLYERVLNIGTDDYSDIASYGSAIHEALDKTVKKMISQKTLPTLDEVKKFFNDELNELSFTPDGKKELKAKGELKLENYYEFIKTWDIQNLYKSEEKKEYTLEGEKFQGRIDRIDKDGDGFIIYDYKTGSVKSQNDISKNGKYENYYNQLAFYKYLLHISEKIELNKIRTILLFPDNNGKTEIQITPEDCIEVKDKYLDIIRKLRNCELDKGDTTNPEKTCKYCSCKSFCAMDIFI